jgi:hypothetical protein
VGSNEMPLNGNSKLPVRLIGGSSMKKEKLIIKELPESVFESIVDSCDVCGHEVELSLKYPNKALIHSHNQELIEKIWALYEIDKGYTRGQIEQIIDLIEEEVV